MSDTADDKLMLASTSPRRAKLLREAGIAFDTVAPPFDDTHADPGDARPARAAEAMAYLKATSVADAHPGRRVLGCDTVIAWREQRLGKPRDRAHAATMLQGLFDDEHQVISAVALVETGDRPRLRLFHDVTTVRIESPSAEAIEAYLAAGAWAGKAGGYNLAELEDRWRFEVIGDRTTVIGLPMQRLAAELASW